MERKTVVHVHHDRATADGGDAPECTCFRAVGVHDVELALAADRVRRRERRPSLRGEIGETRDGSIRTFMPASGRDRSAARPAPVTIVYVVVVGVEMQDAAERHTACARDEPGDDLSDLDPRAVHPAHLAAGRTDDVSRRASARSHQGWARAGARSRAAHPPGRAPPSWGARGRLRWRVRGSRPSASSASAHRLHRPGDEREVGLAGCRSANAGRGPVASDDDDHIGPHRRSHRLPRTTRAARAAPARPAVSRTPTGTRSGSRTPYTTVPSVTARLSHAARPPAATSRVTRLVLPTPPRPGQHHDRPRHHHGRDVHRHQALERGSPQHRIVEQDLPPQRAEACRQGAGGRRRLGRGSPGGLDAQQVVRHLPALSVPRAPGAVEHDGPVGLAGDPTADGCSCRAVLPGRALHQEDVGLPLRAELVGSSRRCADGFAEAARARLDPRRPRRWSTSSVMRAPHLRWLACTSPMTGQRTAVSRSCSRTGRARGRTRRRRPPRRPCARPPRTRPSGW